MLAGDFFLLRGYSVVVSDSVYTREVGDEARAGSRGRKLAVTTRGRGKSEPRRVVEVGN